MEMKLSSLKCGMGVTLGNNPDMYIVFKEGLTPSGSITDCVFVSKTGYMDSNSYTPDLKFKREATGVDIGHYDINAVFIRRRETQYHVNHHCPYSLNTITEDMVKVWDRKTGFVEEYEHLFATPKEIEPNERVEESTFEREVTFY